MKGSQKVSLPTFMTLMYRYLLSIALCNRLCTGSYKKCCPANMNELQKILEKLFSWNLFETRWSSNFTLKKQKLTSETNFYHAQGCTQYANKYHFAQWLFLGIFVRKVFDTNLNFRYQRVKKSKNIRALLLCQLQKLTTWWLYFFRFLTHWYLKLRFVFNTFWTKIPKNSHCVWSDNMIYVLSCNHRSHVACRILTYITMM